VLGSVILGNLEQCFFLILASRTACTVHTKRAIQQYIEPQVTQQKPILKTMYGHLSCCKNNCSEINNSHNNGQYL